MKRFLFTAVLFLASLFCMAYHSIDVSRHGEGPAVVVISGFGGSDAWEDVTLSLKENHSIHLVSIKGVSGKGETGDFNMQEVIDELVGYFNEQAFEHPTVIGHSFGGFMALKFASIHPDLVGKLVIVDFFPFSMALWNEAFTSEVGKQQSQMYESQMVSMPQEKYAEFWKQNLKGMVTSVENQHALFNLIMGSDRQYIIKAQCAMLENDLRPELKNVSCPVLILCSDVTLKKAGFDAQSIQQKIDSQFEGLTNKRIFINESALHFIMLDDSKWLVQKLVQFI